MTDRRIDWRPHLYEIVLVANLLLIYALTARHTNAVFTTLPVVLGMALLSMGTQVIIAIVIRLAIAFFRGNWRGYVAIIRRPAWIIESCRLLLSAGLMLHVYGWIKLVIPLLHPRLYDQELWNIDRMIFFGISPNIFFLNLFNGRLALRTVDFSYGNIFVVGLCVAVGYFISSPVKRLRVAFMTGHVFLWLTGAWLYMLIPSLGPAYRFPDIWLQYADDLSTTQSMQALLWRNYSAVLHMNARNAAPVNILLGIAAFPSLHVGFQTFIFLWFRRIWTWGEVLFAVFVLAIFLGAMITGWHYLIDLIAGMLLAWIVWAVTSRRYRVLRFTRLSRAS